MKQIRSGLFESWTVCIILLFPLIAGWTHYSHAGTPHSVFGHIEYQNGSFPDFISLQAYIIDRPTEILTQNSIGCGYESATGQWYIQCGNFGTDWSSGDVLYVKFQDNTGLSDSVQVVLSNNPTDYAGTSILQVAIRQITVQSDPAAREFQIDGVSYTSSQDFNWAQGSSHTFSTPSPQSGSIHTQYIFTDWSNGQSQTHTYTVGNADQTITASFKTQYFLSVDSEYGSPFGQDWYDVSVTASFGVTPLVSSEPGIQHVFKNWTGTGAGAYAGTNPNPTVVMNNPISQMASWETQVTFTPTVSPVDGGTILPVGGWYQEGIPIEVEARPASEAGYVFLEWSGDLTGSGNPVMLMMDGPKTVTAYFEIPDDHPPSIIECFPVYDAVEIPVNSPIQMRVYDPFPGYGIDRTTLNIFVNNDQIVKNGHDDTTGRVTILSYAENAFHVLYDPTQNFSPSSTVDIQIICQDLSPESKSIDTTYHFSTGTSVITKSNSTIIDEYGGSINDNDTGIRLTIPKDALDYRTEIVIGRVDSHPELPDSVATLGENYYFAPDGIQFKDSIAVYLPYDNSILQEAGISNPLELPIYHFSTRNGSWEKLKNQRIISEMIYLKVTEFCYLTFGKEDNTHIPDENNHSENPTTYDMQQNYPNPFNSKTTIRFQVPKTAFAKISIYDVMGRTIRNLVGSIKQPGYYTAEWDGRNDKSIPVSSGVYLIEMTSGEYSKVIKSYYLK
ncbi:T9SS type A sorting domain-containing protein [bacterium]